MSTQTASASPKGAAASPADLTIDDVRAAAARIGGAVVNTPMMHSITLSEITGADIWLKFENLQFTAAYKERGALNALLLLTQEQRDRGDLLGHRGGEGDQAGHLVRSLQGDDVDVPEFDQADRVARIGGGDGFASAHHFAVRRIGADGEYPFEIIGHACHHGMGIAAVKALAEFFQQRQCNIIAHSVISR